MQYYKWCCNWSTVTILLFIGPTSQCEVCDFINKPWWFLLEVDTLKELICGTRFAFWIVPPHHNWLNLLIDLIDILQLQQWQHSFSQQFCQGPQQCVESKQVSSLFLIPSCNKTYYMCLTTALGLETQHSSESQMGTQPLHYLSIGNAKGGC